jgi:hypothetical protein
VVVTFSVYFALAIWQSYSFMQGYNFTNTWLLEGRFLATDLALPSIFQASILQNFVSAKNFSD